MAFLSQTSRIFLRSIHHLTNNKVFGSNSSFLPRVYKRSSFSKHQFTFTSFANHNHTSSQKKPSLSELLSAISIVIRFGSAAYVVQVYIANSTMSYGPSMLPTLNVYGDIIFTEYISPRLGLLQAGDVIIATKPTDPSVTILKRIRGMSNDQIWIHPSNSSHPILYKVPEDHVWLEGDNRHQSLDSRMYGPVPLTLIRGKLWYRYWPLNQAGRLDSKVIDHTKTERRTSSIIVHAKSESLQNDSDNNNIETNNLSNDQSKNSKEST